MSFLRHKEIYRSDEGAGCGRFRLQTKLNEAEAMAVSGGIRKSIDPMKGRVREVSLADEVERGQSMKVFWRHKEIYRSDEGAGVREGFA